MDVKGSELVAYNVGGSVGVWGWAYTRGQCGGGCILGGSVGMGVSKGGSVLYKDTGVQ